MTLPAACKISGILFPAALLILITLFVLDLVLGSVNIPIESIISIITGAETKDTWINIFYDWRLPKTLTALLAGASLSVAGLLMQTLFRNPLAGPYILGISSGASLGVAIVIMAGGISGSIVASTLGLFGNLGIAVAATAGSAVVMILLLFASRKIESNITILIIGMMFGYITSSIVSVLMQFSASETMQSYVYWSFGSFSGVTWSQLFILLIASIAGLVISFLLVKPLNALLLGDKYAVSMGIDYKKIRYIIIINTSLLAGIVTAFCGPIGFLGVAVPHLCRSLFVTGNHRTLVPACIIMGGIIAIASDIIAQVPGTGLVLPLNAVTALFGAPVIIWIILRGTKYGRGIST
ncbi:transport system permease protein [Methanolacinia petrolearia DSM 11571]|uniref:Transport system permease protein n=1 Tax=Methanolacinia petrolearia (strain DSM 11571 / OCM 486 / SEBR 4847) TaxID=679926 RepID=E1RKP4_METP4|nr:iron ABC transporter permease [Methanolacinia petrolearia]ADN36983.1 transport system permease protein [Methanolacinia petrolearia DSM 11571]